MEVEGEGRKYVAQIVHGQGRTGGDRFGVLDKDGLGYREVNLAEWFAEAGRWTGREKTKAKSTERKAA